MRGRDVVEMLARCWRDAREMLLSYNQVVVPQSCLSRASVVRPSSVGVFAPAGSAPSAISVDIATAGATD